MIDQKITSQIQYPKLPKELHFVDLSIRNIQNEEVFSTEAFYDCIIENQIAENLTFKQCIFKNVVFNNILFKFIDLTDVRFENCDLSNTDLSKAVIHRVELVNCKVIGINLGDSTLRNVVFKQCNGNYACFRFANFGQVIFKDCLLRNTDFGESFFSKVTFHCSDLQLAQMSGTKLKEIDFSNSEIEGLGSRLEDLSGAIISPVQAVSLSKKMGLIIKE